MKTFVIMPKGTHELKLAAKGCKLIASGFLQVLNEEGQVVASFREGELIGWYEIEARQQAEAKRT